MNKTPEEELIPDERGGLSPAEMVDRKLRFLLGDERSQPKLLGDERSQPKLLDDERPCLRPKSLGMSTAEREKDDEKSHNKEKDDEEKSRNGQNHNGQSRNGH